MEHNTGDPELGHENVVIKNEPNSQPKHGWDSSDALIGPLLPVVQPNQFGVTKRTGSLYRDIDGTIRNLPRSLAEMLGVDKDVWEKLKLGRPAYALEYIAEWDRMLSSQSLHQEQTSAHNEIRRRIARRMLLLNVVHFLFTGIMYSVLYGGYVEGRPKTIVSSVTSAEGVLFVSLNLLTIWGWHEHDKRAPGEYRFKFDFENLPALKEVVGEQKWKDMQESSDHIRVLDDLTEIITSFRQSQTTSSPSIHDQC